GPAQIGVGRKAGIVKLLRGADAMLGEHHHQQFGVHERARVKEFHPRKFNHSPREGNELGAGPQAWQRADFFRRRWRRQASLAVRIATIKNPSKRKSQRYEVAGVTPRMAWFGRIGDASAIAGFRRAAGTRFVAGRTVRLVAAAAAADRVESASSVGVVTWKVRAGAARRGSG